MAVGGSRGLTCRACACGRRDLIRGRWYLSDYWDCAGHGLGYGIDDGPDHAGEFGGQRWLATSSSLGLLCGERQEQADPAARDRKPRRSENNAARIRLRHRQTPGRWKLTPALRMPGRGVLEDPGLLIGGRRRAFRSAASVQCRILSEQGVPRPDTRPESMPSPWCCGSPPLFGPSRGSPCRSAVWWRSAPGAGGQSAGA